MNRTVARWGKGFAARLGVRVRRAGPDNRFEAMADTLRQLQRRGYAPATVIDGGANVGQWASLAAAVFPTARFHLIEPQPVCQKRLRSAFLPPRFDVHACAITEPGVERVRLAGGAGDGTGAFVTDRQWEAQVDVVEAAATTLDALVGHVVAPGDRALLKLDLEGHELPALRGALVLLGRIEVIVAEVSFYDIHHQGRALFGDIIEHLDQAGFEVYDVAALYDRPRDHRLRMADVVFVRRDSPLQHDVAWD